MVVASKMGIEATFVITVSNWQGRFLRSVVRVVEDNWTYVCARFGRTDVDFLPGGVVGHDEDLAAVGNAYLMG